jgi:acyl-CoA reductase-like NAD-dependent aldehyde dehydrogenase
MTRLDVPRSLEVRSPFDGAPVGSVPLTDQDGLEHALETAYRLFRHRSDWLPPRRRIEILDATANMIERDAEALALLAAREGGKPLADSRAEVARAIDGVRNCCELLRAEAGRTVPMDVNAASAGRVAFTQPEPIGVVVAISAFNHPLNLIVHQVAPAIAAGCPVIVKPASATPLSCFRFVAMLHEAGLPEDWCQAINLESDELAGRLAADPRVGFLSFIGSARVGWMLRAQLAPGARCALEHGGAAPVIVAADADLDQAVPTLAKGGFYHAGQVCVSVQRVFAHASIASELAQWLAERADALKVGDPTSPDTEVGPLIRAGEVERVHAWVQEAVAGGGTLICGGQPLSQNCYRPTVVFDPPDDCRLSREEIFGPVVAVYPYDDLGDALDRANALPWAFQAAVFTRDYATAMRAYRGLDASAVMLNDHTAFRVDWMPFAGLRHSGLGVGGIPHTFREMQVEKLFVGPMR